ncbi:hypothetical protein L6164_032891 [Bauhinia variegata]|uniref:Uncharacterized protein n=1 Tax=Bauhinia variegata TaxID=167791 RepID=A0ACB9KQW5_BAUVA|nr:hypothetical protein L6164_032891 [Bauhinia variegata]
MNLSATFLGNLIPLSQCSLCCDLRFQQYLSPSNELQYKQCRRTSLKLIQNRRYTGNREIACRVTESQTEPDSNNEEEKAYGNGETQPLSDSIELKQSTYFSSLKEFHDKPVAVVVPRLTLQPETTAVPELSASGAFGLVTAFTLLLHNVPTLQPNLLSTFDNLNLLSDGIPGAPNYFTYSGST